MKNILLTLVACIATSFIYAQSSNDASENSTFKPSGNSWSTELNINPFSALSLNTLNQIKFRKFVSEKTALRIGFNINRISSDEEDNNPYGSSPTIYRDEKSSTTLGLSLGLEKLFKGTKRLSPYMGFDFAISDKSSKQEITNGQTKTTIKGAWRNYSYVYVPNYNNNGSSYVLQSVQSSDEYAYTSYGLNLISGFDFYVSQHFFIGGEFNLGFSQTNYKDVTVTQTGSTSNNNSDQKNNVFQFGTSSYNGIRIGYIF
ncbi:MAG: hypothetical protein H7Y13_12590 [Sphingobacteriaceae bacterium]|nr:hypothetical protein [Sphingobacteriaceae bacterium]